MIEIMGLRIRSGLAAAAVFLLLLPPVQAWAWGSEGHRIIADIAWDHLNDTTRERLRQFLGDNDLASISTEVWSNTAGFICEATNRCQISL